MRLFQSLCTKQENMPIINVHRKNVVLPNYDFSDKYWPILTELLFEKIGEVEIKDPADVESLLKECFVKLCAVFSKKISEQKKASFYIFCQNLHEDSIELWLKQIEKISLGINEEDFAASRRVLKIILEQSCKLNLIGTPNFYVEINSNLDYYTDFLEELLYLGTWCYTLSEFIARSQLFPNSIGLQVIDSKLNILTYQPYTTLYKFIFIEMPKHNANVVLSDSIKGFKEILKNYYHIEYDALSSFINQQLIHPQYRFGLTKINNLIDEIHNEFKYNKEFLITFYSGLTVNKTNSLSVEKCFLNNQHENRHMFRPILELNVDGDIYHMIGYNKWLESLTTLTTNSFPFGLYPIEWQKYPQIKRFVSDLENSHDKVLEEPVAQLLKESSFVFDVNVKSFQQMNENSINITKTVGDIDVLFIDKRNDIIYVCECKHNRSRFDMNN